ncbi:olfactory receptor 5A2-like [Dipodomys spectabilis]|uniref:olfactory receptor 5A2-like n=1 Tax=Dipodomys spectabilis TaxID=105255 RepID=UPI001C539CB5|nr:olfactory receptor 5A2-like [Dipodomys spectabilis]
MGAELLQRSSSKAVPSGAIGVGSLSPASQNFRDDGSLQHSPGKVAGRKSMAIVAIGRNNTSVTKFILLGFTDNPQIKVFLFALFLGIYLLTLIWNLTLIALIRMDPHLHTPMYFFLRNLSFIDICYVSSTTPKMLSVIITEQKTISLLGCAMQYFVFCGLGLTECFLLAAMAYDRYAAICHPLLYTALISHTLCLKMVAGAYVGGFLSSLVETCSIYQNDFCGPNVINHFFCDLPPILALSCSDTFTSQVLCFILGCIDGVVSVLIILISYGYIVAAVLKISSAEGRTKAFSTCASHLTTLTLFYGSGLFMYMRPRSSYSLNRDKVVSIFYAVVIPMTNPVIYSLRNKEIKNAIRKVMERDHVFIPGLSCF